MLGTGSDDFFSQESQTHSGTTAPEITLSTPTDDDGNLQFFINNIIIMLIHFLQTFNHHHPSRDVLLNNLTISTCISITSQIQTLQLHGSYHKLINIKLIP